MDLRECITDSICNQEGILISFNYNNQRSFSEIIESITDLGKLEDDIEAVEDTVL